MPDDLLATLAEIEAHVHGSGWDRPAQLFALAEGNAYEQDPLPDGPLDEVLAGIEWPDEVDGCALTQEILILPPEAEAELARTGEGDVTTRAAADPRRREARLVAGVLRDGRQAALLRLRGDAAGPDEIVTGEDLAPNLVAALRETLSSAGPTASAGA